MNSSRKDRAMRYITRSIIVILFIILFLANFSIANADTKNVNLELTENFCKTNYPECSIKFFTVWDEETMDNRENTNIIYVEILHSRADGVKGGWTKEGWYIAYNTKVEKGTIVKSYLIYNPYSNYCDDIVAVVDNGLIR